VSLTPLPRVYGIMAEFDTPVQLIHAAEQARESGYRKMEAYTPFPIEELAHVLRHERTPLPYIVLAGGILGGLAGFGLCYWSSVIAYPLNIGGRPFNSWPSFIPVTFECTILFAALAAVLGMLGLNALPMPNHPVFNVERFALASRDRYFLCIQARDPQFERERTRHFLQGLDAYEVNEVGF